MGSKADLKKCWFAVLQPTHPKQAPPKNVLPFGELFFKFSLNAVYKCFFEIIKSCILIEERLQRLLLYAFLPYIQHA